MKSWSSSATAWFKRMATKPNKILNDPVIRAVLEQQIPGAYVAGDAGFPGIKSEKEARQVTDDLGLAFYLSKDEKTQLVFNPATVSADEQGQLTQIFPEYNQLLGGGASEEEAPTPQAALGSPPRRAAAPADKLAAMTPPSPPGASNLLGAMQAPTI